MPSAVLVHLPPTSSANLIQSGRPPGACNAAIDDLFSPRLRPAAGPPCAYASTHRAPRRIVFRGRAMSTDDRIVSAEHLKKPFTKEISCAPLYRKNMSEVWGRHADLGESAWHGISTASLRIPPLPPAYMKNGNIHAHPGYQGGRRRSGRIDDHRFFRNGPPAVRVRSVCREWTKPSGRARRMSCGLVASCAKSIHPLAWAIG